MQHETLKKPACTEYVLRHLYYIEDALIRNQFLEALNYTGDALAKVQNEIDWCYRTDVTLPFILEYLLLLSDTLQKLQHLMPSYRKEQVPLLINVIRDTRHLVEKVTANQAQYEEPDRYIDVLESEHRATIYQK
jgi:hypothetical protein